VAEDDDADLPQATEVEGTTDAPVPVVPVGVTVEPANWNADRLDLTAVRVGEHLGQLRLPPVVIEQVCAALLVGQASSARRPARNGEHRAGRRPRAGRAERALPHGAYVATASADWTTFDTIGGYTLRRDSSLAFRSGEHEHAPGWQRGRAI
jgi:hypothetical protein